MRGITLKEYLNPMRIRQCKISSRVQKNPLGLIAVTPHNFKLTVLLPCVILFITRRIFRQKYGGYRSFHIQYFYTCGKLTSPTVDTNISHQIRYRLLYEKEANTDIPPPASNVMWDFNTFT